MKGIVIVKIIWWFFAVILFPIYCIYLIGAYLMLIPITIDRWLDNWEIKIYLNRE